MAEPMIDQNGLTAALMTDLVVGNVSSLLQEARNDCPSTAHANWCIREAMRTLARFSAIAPGEETTKVLTDLAMLFDPETVRAVLDARADAAEEPRAA